MLALLVAGCFGFYADEGSIVGTHWRAVRVGALVPTEGREPTLTLGPGRVSGSAGCNAYSSQGLKVGDGRIELGSIESTLRGCPDLDLSRVEHGYLEALREVDRYEFQDGRLVLSGPAGVLVFDQVSVDAVTEPSGVLR